MFARAGVRACARSDVQAESGVHAVNLAAGLWSELLGTCAQHIRSAAAARTHTHTASNVTATPSSCTGAAAPGEITHALTLRSAQLTYALLRGPKCIENRDFRMQPGWYALHTGEQTEPLASQRPLLAKMQSLPLEADLPHSAIVGAIRVSHTLTLGQCTADAWAFGPMCNVVDASISLDTPIQHTGALSVWRVGATEVAQLRLQLQTAPIIPKDVSHLPGPLWLRGLTAADLPVLTVPQLKDELRQRGLHDTGKRDTLESRLGVALHPPGTELGGASGCSSADSTQDSTAIVPVASRQQRGAVQRSGGVQKSEQARAAQHRGGLDSSFQPM